MPTEKNCSLCKEKIRLAAKTCKHCGTKQPAKEMLEKKKQKFTEEWKERQRKNCSINKIYDATNLLVSFFFLSNAFICLLFYVSSIYSTPWFMFSFMHFIFKLNQHEKSRLRKGHDQNLLRSQFKARILCKRWST